MLSKGSLKFGNREKVYFVCNRQINVENRIKLERAERNSFGFSKRIQLDEENIRIPNAYSAMWIMAIYSWTFSMSLNFSSLAVWDIACFDAPNSRF